MDKINPFKIRSLLFVPAIKKEFIDKIIDLEGINKPDGIIFDLEDSVHLDYKDEARKNLDELFKNKEIIDKLKDKYIICIRINKYGTKWFKNDLRFINQIKPNFLMLAKVESAKEVRIIRKKSKIKQLIAPIETLEGLKYIKEITSELNFYDIFACAYEDTSAELLIDRPENLNYINPLTFFLMNCIIEARRNNLIMLESPSRKFADEKGLKECEEEATLGKNNGFTGKFAIHPNQVAIINKIFDKKVIVNRAEKVLGQFKDLKDGTSVIVNENKEMMDTPSYKMYSKLLGYWNK